MDSLGQIDGAAGQLAVKKIPLADLESQLTAALSHGKRLATFTARLTPAVDSPDSPQVSMGAIIIDPTSGAVEYWEMPLPAGQTSFPSVSLVSPLAHWFERAIWDLFGIEPTGHPRPTSLLLHEAWPRGFYPLNPQAASSEIHEALPKVYEFLSVQGSSVYELPVGPIHAGIIEPGHFRLSCVGEVIQNLEIRLGYQHRGIERQLTDIDWHNAHFLAEASSSDTTAGNALAHAKAIEQLLGLTVSPRVQWIRALAIEIERAASHVGDLGGICADIGYSGGAALFARLRGGILGLAERVTGTRLQTGFIRPGGVRHEISDSTRSDIDRTVPILAAQFQRAGALLMDNPGALERMEGTGLVNLSVARDLGVVGPVARACGIPYDVRQSLPEAPYDSLKWAMALESGGDVLARVRVRIFETQQSLSLIAQLMDSLPASESPESALPKSLPANRVAAGIVEAWRGELVHLICTDRRGRICRYHVKDPSFNNWAALSLAVREEMVADFPLCNKSFGLSYSGSDL